MAANAQTSIVIEAVNNASTEINKISRDLDELKGAAKNAGEGMSSFNNSMNSLASQLAKIGGALSLTVTAPLVALGKAMVDQVSSIEQYKIAFDVMLGSVEKGSEMLQKITDFAIKTPFTLPEVAAASKQLLAFGISGEKIIPTLKSIGDVASGTGTDLSRLILNFGQVATQGKLTGRELRDFSVAGVPLVAELAKNLGVAKDQIQGMVSSGQIGFPAVEQAFTSMTSKGGRFFDLMDKQSKTLAGTLSNMKDDFVKVSMAFLGISQEAGHTGEIIKGSIFESLKKLATEGLAGMDKLVKMFNELDQTTKNTILAVAGFVAALGPLALVAAAIAAIIATLSTTVGIIVAGFAAFGLALIFLRDSGLAPLLIAVSVAVASFMAMSAIMPLLTGGILTMSGAMGVAASATIALEGALAILTGPIGLIALALGVITLGFISMKKAEGELRESTDTLYESLSKLGNVNINSKKIGDQLKSLMATVKKDSEEMSASAQINANIKGGTFSNTEIEQRKKDIDDLRAKTIEMGRAFGATQPQIEGMTKDLTFFKEYVNPTSEDLKTLNTELNRLNSVEFTDAINAFNSTVQNYQKGGLTISQAVTAARSDMKVQWDLAGQDSKALATGVVDNFISQTAKVQSVGAAYALAFKTGITATEATEAIKGGGTMVSDTLLGTLMADAVKVRNRGELDGLLYAAGIEKKKRDVILAAGNLSAAVSKALRDKQSEIASASKRTGEVLAEGIAAGLSAKFGGILNMVNKINGTLGTMVKFAGIDMKKGLSGFIQGIIPNKADEQAKAYADGINKVAEAASSSGESATKAKKEWEKFADSQVDVANKIKETENILNVKAGGSKMFDTAQINDYQTFLKNVTSVVGDLQKKIEETRAAHQKFIDEAKKGIDEYGDKLSKIKDKYTELNKKLQEGATSDITNLAIKNLEDEKKLTEELVAANKKLIEVKTEKVSGDAAMPKHMADIAEQEAKILDITKQIENAKASTAEINKQYGTSFITDPAAAKAALTEEQKKTIEIGKQVGGVKELMDASIALYNVEQSGTALELIQYKAGVQKKAYDEQQKADEKHLANLNEINKAIVAGTITHAEFSVKNLTAKGFTTEEIKVATDAQSELRMYREKLNAESRELNIFKTGELKIYNETYEAIKNGQKNLEETLTTSYNNLIGKLNDVRVASEAALIAQNNARGKTTAPGTTLPGNVSSVASEGWKVNTTKNPSSTTSDAMASSKPSGLTLGQTTNNTPINMTNIVNSPMDFNAIAKMLSWKLRTA